MLPYSCFTATRRRRGNGILGLLIVVVIMLILTYSFLSPSDQKNQVNQAVTYIDRSKDAACKMNIDGVRTQVQELQINNQGITITPRLLEKKGILQKCPGGGEYVIKNGQIYCTKHSPPPEESPAVVTSSTQPMVTQPVAETPAAAAPEPQAMMNRRGAFRQAVIERKMQNRAGQNQAISR